MQNTESNKPRVNMQTIGEPSITCNAILRSWQKITYLPLDTQQWVQHAPLPLDCFDFESPPLNSRAIIITIKSTTTITTTKQMTQFSIECRK